MMASKGKDNAHFREEEESSSNPEVDVVAGMIGVTLDFLDINRNQPMEEPMVAEGLVEASIPVAVEASNNCQELPEEVWKDIFDTLKYPDMLNCFRSSQQWRNWLASKKTLLFFPEVLQLLGSDLPLQERLRLRSVCQKWKDDVDDALLPSTPMQAVTFESTADIQRFLDEMRLHPGNPFPLRSVCFKHGLRVNRHQRFNNQEVSRLRSAFWMKANELLDYFGHDVWTLYIFLDQHRDECLQQCLSRVSHLKRLSVTCGTRFEDFKLPGISDRSLQEQMATRYPLPRLLHLEEVRVSRNVSNTIVDNILLNCCAPEAIKKLELANDGAQEDTVFEFPNLEVLEAEVYDGDLEMLLNLKPPLRSLTLKVTRMIGGFAGEVDFVGLFSTLEQFADTLTYLHLKGSRVLKMSCPTAFRINLPKLETLKLWEYDGPLDPLIDLDSLKYLQISNFKAISSPIRGSVVDFEGYEQHIDYSNIWGLIPTLGVIEYSVKTRNGDFACSGNRPRVTIPPSLARQLVRQRTSRGYTGREHGNPCEKTDNPMWRWARNDRGDY